MDFKHRTALRVLLFLALISSILCSTAYGQVEIAEPSAKTRVYLKDGSILVGQLLSDDDYAVEMILISGDTVRIGYKYIESVGSREAAPITKYRNPKIGKEHNYGGTFIYAEIGGSWSDNEDNGGGQFFLTAGQRISRKLNLGGGIGYVILPKTFRFIWLEPTFVPLYGYSRYYFNEKVFRIYSSAKLGYGISTNRDPFLQFNTVNNYGGGLFGQIGVGVHIANRKKIKALIELNGTYQHTSGHYEALDFNGLPVSSDYNIHFLRPGLTVGIEF